MPCDALPRNRYHPATTLASKDGTLQSAFPCRADLSNLMFKTSISSLSPVVVWGLLLWGALAGVARDAKPDDGSSSVSAGKRFSIQRRDGIDWLVRPNGERFFSLGVCV